MALAELPLEIRGFGPVKADAAAQRARRCRREALLAEFRAGAGAPGGRAARLGARSAVCRAAARPLALPLLGVKPLATERKEARHGGRDFR